MPVPIEITTVGARVRWRTEITRNVRPEQNYIDLLGVSTAPAFDMSPETVDMSTLADYYTQYLAGRQDPGNDALFTLNHSEAAIDAWNEMCEASRIAMKEKKRTWFEYYYPDGQRSYFFCGQPLPLGNGGIEQNVADTIPAHVIPYGRFGWYATSTYCVAYIDTENKFYFGTDNMFYVGADNQIFA